MKFVVYLERWWGLRWLRIGLWRPHGLPYSEALGSQIPEAQNTILAITEVDATEVDGLRFRWRMVSQPEPVGIAEEPALLRRGARGG